VAGKPRKESEQMKKETKHTPGPWTVGQKGDYGTYNANVIYAGSEGICAVGQIPLHTKLEQISGEPRWQTGLANARLIAAAPDLLEACKHLVAAIERGNVEMAEVAAESASAAIAKAEGKELQPVE
jgi:hypothetical protein